MALDRSDVIITSGGVGPTVDDLMGQAIANTNGRKLNKYVLRRLKQHQHEIITAAPVWHELHYGSQRLPVSRKRKILESFLIDVLRPSMIILPYDEQAAETHAKERARLSARGEVPSFVDGQLAAIAIVNGLTLVTRNTSDFKGFSGLKIENWHKE